MYQTMILPLWGFIDHLYYQCNRLQHVDDPEENIFRVRVTTYRGYSLPISDGSIIETGDRLLKIHLHNYRLMLMMANLNSDVRRALFVYEAVEKSLPGLSRYIQSLPEADEIKGIMGVTLLNRGIKRLGFDSFDIKNQWYRRWKKSYMLPMYALCHGDWQALTSRSGKLEPKYVVMSKQTLLQRYN